MKFRELVRKKKQLSEASCEYVLRTERRGVVSVIGDEGYPYGTPMNHFYNEEDGIYISTAASWGTVWMRSEPVIKHLSACTSREVPRMAIGR